MPAMMAVSFQCEECYFLKDMFEAKYFYIIFANEILLIFFKVI